MDPQEPDSSSMKTFPGEASEGQREFSGGRRLLRWIFLAKKFWNWLRVQLGFPLEPANGFQDQDISSENGKDYRRGRPTIPDNFLLDSRNAWVSLLEQSWPEIGWPLQCIRNRRSSTIEDVRRAFEPLKGKPVSGLATDFYRESAEAADAEEVRKNSVKHLKLNAVIYETQTKRDKQQWLCQEAEAALQAANPNNKGAIQAEADRRKERLLQLEDTLKKIENERDVLYKKLLAQMAYACQSELLDFLLSIGRYAINPRNIADALAGLPTMKWRQSWNRCSKMPYDSEPHLWYRVLETIEEIWKHRSAESAQPTVEFFRTELLSLPMKSGYVRQFLWEHWRDLRLALEESCKKDYPTQSIPSVITNLFLQNLNRPRSAAERVLADQEKLGVFPADSK